MFSEKGHDYVTWKQILLQCVNQNLPEEYLLAHLREAVHGGQAKALIADSLDSPGAYEIACGKPWFGGSDRHLEQKSRSL